MNEKTLRAIAEMVRLAARARGYELGDVEITFCNGDAEAILARMEESDAQKNA